MAGIYSAACREPSRDVCCLDVTDVNNTDTYININESLQ